MRPLVGTSDADMACAVDVALMRAESAQRRYGDFASLHEALGVLTEEFREFEDAVRKRQEDPSRQIDAEQEAFDIAAVALRIAVQARRLTR